MGSFFFAESTFLTATSQSLTKCAKSLCLATMRPGENPSSHLTCSMSSSDIHVCTSAEVAVGRGG